MRGQALGTCMLVLPLFPVQVAEQFALLNLRDSRAHNYPPQWNGSSPSTLQAEASKWSCISQNFNERRARAAHSDWRSLVR
jgi:hypothetical protein